MKSMPCEHAVPRGYGVELGREPSFWWCEKRGRDACQGPVNDCRYARDCDRYQPAAKQNTGDETMTQTKHNWDGPAQDVVPEAGDEETLAEWAQRVGGGQAAKTLGISTGTVFPALKRRFPESYSDKAKRPTKRPQRVKLAEKRCPVEAQDDPVTDEPSHSVAPKPDLTVPVSPNHRVEPQTASIPTVQELTGFIISTGQMKRFDAWLTGARWAGAGQGVVS